MTLEQYQQETIKTLKHRGSLYLDIDHMIIGMFSEINELMDAIKTDDRVNIIEELGDLSWYTVTYATLKKIKLVPREQGTPSVVGDIVYNISKLSNFYKRDVIYNKIQESAVEEALLNKVFNDIINFGYWEGSDLTTFDTSEIFGRNIAKLHKVRYKNAIYTDEAAQVRDEVAERKELEK